MSHTSDKQQHVACAYVVWFHRMVRRVAGGGGGGGMGEGGGGHLDQAQHLDP